jgi:hypothetical protein
MSDVTEPQRVLAAEIDRLRAKLETYRRDHEAMELVRKYRIDIVYQYGGCSARWGRSDCLRQTDCYGNPTVAIEAAAKEIT